MRARRDAALRLLKTMLVASIVIPISIFSYVGWVNYEAALVHADEQLAGSLTLLSEQALKVFQSVDHTFTRVSFFLSHPLEQQLNASHEPLPLSFTALTQSLSSFTPNLI